MAEKEKVFTVGIPVYQGVDLLDVAAPCEIFSWAKEAVAKQLKVNVYLIAETKRAIKTRDGHHLTPQKTFKNAPQLDLLWVPGGNLDGLGKMMSYRPYQDFLKAQSEQATYVASVCEGAMLLASAGLLNGHKATTHWAFIPCLKAYRHIKIATGYPRFVVNKFKDAEGRERYVVTGGGISSGLDEALELVKIIFGAEVATSAQVTMQYFPKPPVKGKIRRAKDCPLSSAEG